jgi:ribosomal protein S27E
MMENKLDGNAAAGILQAIFPFEMTLAQVTCTGCGATNAIGATAAYMHGMGTIVRCPSCDNVLIRIAHARGRHLLDMRGVRVLQMKEG